MHISIRSAVFLDIPCGICAVSYLHLVGILFSIASSKEIQRSQIWCARSFSSTSVLLIWKRFIQIILSNCVVMITGAILSKHDSSNYYFIMHANEVQEITTRCPPVSLLKLYIRHRKKISINLSFYQTYPDGKHFPNIGQIHLFVHLPECNDYVWSLINNCPNI